MFNGINFTVSTGYARDENSLDSMSLVVERYRTMYLKKNQMMGELTSKIYHQRKHP